MFIDCLHLACFCKILLKCPMVNYLWTNKYLYFYMYISVYINKYIYICILCLLSRYKMYLLMYSCLCLQTDVYIYSHIYVYVCAYLYISIYLHVYVTLCVFTYTYTSIFMYRALRMPFSKSMVHHHRRQPAMIHPKHCSGRKTSKISVLNTVKGLFLPIFWRFFWHEPFFKDPLEKICLFPNYLI